MPTNKIQVTLLLRTAMVAVSKRLKKGIPETGTFEKESVSYQLLNSKYNISLAVEPDAINPDSRCLTANVFRSDDDRVVTNYLANGSNKELINYLKNSDELSKLTDTFLHLLEKAEDFD